jgi:NAD(P)-dependent dehydrogenase (short-subunit alcohol dehydrogenase family)
VLDVGQDLLLCRAVGLQFVGNDDTWNILQATQQSFEEALRRLRVSPALDENVEHDAVLINGTPEIVQFAPDPDEDLVQIPLVSGSRASAAQGVGELSAYAATKGAVDTLVKHFASALGGRGIRVNAVAPGVVDTDMSSFTKSEAGRTATLAMQALKRVAAPDDIAEVIAYLASD